MRRLPIVLFLCAATTACNSSANPEQPASKAELAQTSFDGADYKTDEEKVAHGKRLADILDCTGCHGPNLQGTDLADKPEDGSMYAPNITLLLAKYSDADLEKLIRHGEPKDGREFWFMPVESFQFLSDKDLAAVVAYLRTLNPAGKELPPFKFNRVEIRDVQQGLLGNAKAQIAKYRNDPPPDMGQQHALGRYVAQTVCSACHNNALQGWEGFTPNLDIAGAYSEAELTHLLTTGEGKVKKDLGMMSAVARNHFSKFTPNERSAVIRYVKARAERPQ